MSQIALHARVASIFSCYQRQATQPRPSPAVKLCTLLTSGIQPYSESIELVSHKTTERDADIVEMSEEARANSERHRVPEREREADATAKNSPTKQIVCLSLILLLFWRSQFAQLEHTNLLPL